MVKVKPEPTTVTLNYHGEQLTAYLNRGVLRARDIEIPLDLFLDAVEGYSTMDQQSVYTLQRGEDKITIEDDTDPDGVVVHVGDMKRLKGLGRGRKHTHEYNGFTTVWKIEKFIEVIETARDMRS